MQILSKTPIKHVEDFRGFSPVPLGNVNILPCPDIQTFGAAMWGPGMDGSHTENTEVLGTTVLSLVARRPGH
jgi:hypothetical protein